MQHGLYKRLPYERYRVEEGVNFSRLKELVRSPKHYAFRIENPKDTHPMRLGSAAHTAILEPHRFLAEYALWDERTDDGKVRPRRGKGWDAFVVSSGGKRIVKADEYHLAMAMRDAVRSHKPAMRYLRKGDSEVSMWWADADTERECKGRVDWLTVDGNVDVLVGVKTARDCRCLPFGNAAAKLGYHLQWAFYADGYEAITGKSPRVVEIVVESAPPHDVAVYIIPAEILDVGRDEYRTLLKKLAECEEADEWPGSAAEEQILSFPTWVYAGEDDVTELGLET